MNAANAQANQMSGVINTQGNALNNSLNTQVGTLNNNINTQTTAANQMASNGLNAASEKANALNAAVNTQDNQINNVVNRSDGVINSLGAAVDNAATQVATTGNAIAAAVEDAATRGATAATSNILTITPASFAPKIIVNSTAADIAWFSTESLSGTLQPIFAAAGAQPCSLAKSALITLANSLLSVKTALLAAMRADKFKKLTNAQFKDYLTDKSIDLQAQNNRVGDGTPDSVSRLVQGLDKDYFVLYATGTNTAQIAQAKQVFASAYTSLVQSVVSAAESKLFMSFYTAYQTYQSSVVLNTSGVGTINAISGAATGLANGSAATINAISGAIVNSANASTIATNNAYQATNAAVSGAPVVAAQQVEPTRGSVGGQTVTVVDQTTGTAATVIARRGG